MGKAYVVFVGREPGVYGTWVEASTRTSGFKGAIYQSFKTRKDAEIAFQIHLDKISAPTSFTSSGNESSCAASSSNSGKKLSKSEKITNLKDALEEIKQQLDALQISDDD